MRKPMLLSKIERRMVERYRALMAESDYDVRADWHQPSLAIATFKVNGVKDGPDGGGATLFSTATTFVSFSEEGVPKAVDDQLDVATVGVLEQMARNIRHAKAEVFRAHAVVPKGEAAQAQFDSYGEVSHA